MCVRLQWESKVADIIQRMQEYIEEKFGGEEPEMLCRIYIRRIEHLYYKVGVRKSVYGISCLHLSWD